MPRRFLNPDPADAAPVPYDGVPGHLWEPVVSWFCNATSNTAQLRTIGLRLEVTWAPLSSAYVVANAERLIDSATSGSSDPEMLLELANALLSVSEGYDAQALDEILLEGGSLYTISEDECGLERRVSDEVREAFGAAVSAVSGPTSAATHLRAAWAKLYGLNPDERAAYDQAVLALEAVVCPIAIPNDPKPTLGKAIAAMRQAPDAFWLPPSSTCSTPSGKPRSGMPARLARPRPRQRKRPRVPCISRVPSAISFQWVPSEGANGDDYISGTAWQRVRSRYLQTTGDLAAAALEYLSP